MKYAAVGPISIYLPEAVETNEDLKRQYPRWDMELIASKTGIQQRHIAAPDECSSDLGVAAARRLFADHAIDPGTIDFLLFCSQSPDYPLPTTACLIQERLGLPTVCGALDFNLGCSGYVYGLAMANGLIQSGAARRVLFITAETYSKYIDEGDRSLRTIFGDGAAATLIYAHETPSLTAFQFGTDGSGADTLLVTNQGLRPAKDALKPRGRHRWKSDLYMDGPSLISFTVAAIPKLVETILAVESLGLGEIDQILMHQATYKMLDALRRRLDIDEDRLPMALAHCGNTVSSTLPILIEQQRRAGRLRPHAPNLLVGFGVGWSWAGCVWREQPAEQWRNA